MGETSQQQAAVKTRQPIPAVASLAISPERIERMWKMTARERVAAARQGKLTLGEMLRWAARRPHEVELVEGEWWFITALLADTDVGSG
jgi:predicted lysophospholipase L1 biosynthesis ABC-type transport system permease subunit